MSLATPSFPDNPLREKAADFQQRIRNGEKIPREDLLEFITSAQKIIRKEARKIEAKPTDVEFF